MKPKLCKTLMVSEDSYAKLWELKHAWSLDSASDTILRMYTKLQEQSTDIGALRVQIAKFAEAKKR